MVALLNLLWLVLAGWWLALAYLAFGVVACLFVVTIPFGVQAFKLAGYALWPFGRVVVDRSNADVALSALANLVWFFVAGLWLALAHVVAGVALCLTIVGIPFGIASFKMAGLALAPFGRDVVDAVDAERMGMPVIVYVQARRPEPRVFARHRRA
jgi:uncharacterized membrane protein YccF (DUF307 family)